MSISLSALFLKNIELNGSPFPLPPKFFQLSDSLKTKNKKLNNIEVFYSSGLNISFKNKIIIHRVYLTYWKNVFPIKWNIGIVFVIRFWVAGHFFKWSIMSSTGFLNPNMLAFGAIYHSKLKWNTKGTLSIICLDHLRIVFWFLSVYPFPSSSEMCSKWLTPVPCFRGLFLSDWSCSAHRCRERGECLGVISY